MSTDRLLVTGGVRSGKSRLAEERARAHGSVVYVATSERRDDDPEWAGRIAAHAARRPADWEVTETLDVPAVLASRPDALVLVDCVGVWLTRVLGDAGCWADDPAAGALQAARARCVALVAAVRAAAGPVVLVTNEVGWGVVPATRSGRLFADELGRLNSDLAAACDEVVLCVAGLSLTLKAPG